MLFEFFIVVCAGLVFGSFITCASYRLPLEQDVVSKPSYCPKCDKKLGFKDLFPVFSWLFSGGKCRYCSAKISIRYPIIEIITAGLFSFIYLKFSITPEFFILSATSVMLMIMIVADLEHFIIPDCVHVILLPLAFAYRYINGALNPDILWGFGLMTGLAMLLHYGYSKMRGRTMLGYGDVKFFAVAGVWLNLEAIPGFLLLSGILGVLLGLAWRALGKGPVFPFGPALAIALFLGVIYPQSINILYYIK